jgi:phosphatidylserine decarboxylase
MAVKTERKTTRAAQHILWRSLLGISVWATGGILALMVKSSFFTVLVGVFAVWTLFCLFVFYFFRDPTPRVPQDRDTIVSPAHGVVDCVEEANEPEFMRGRCRRLSVFLSVFDVHVQNAPVAGKVVSVRQQSGRFMNALETASSACNENVLIGIASREQPGERVAVRQVAGLIARRIESWVKPDDLVARGQRLGMIHFGSRCDLYLPLSTQVTIKPGDRVVGGETVVARRQPGFSTPSDAP